MQSFTDARYYELSAIYDGILNEPIVFAPPQDPTVFDISEYRHYEEVISNWYAFFFNPSREHLLDDLFLNSLINIINDEHNSEFFMEDCSVELEFSTNKGGSIDLVLYEQSEEDGKFESAIVVENKIRAPLNNDLNGLLGKKDYEVVTIKEIEQFGETILKKLRNDWFDLLEDVTTYFMEVITQKKKDV